MAKFSWVPCGVGAVSANDPPTLIAPPSGGAALNLSREERLDAGGRRVRVA